MIFHYWATFSGSMVCTSGVITLLIAGRGPTCRRPSLECNYPPGNSSISPPNQHFWRWLHGGYQVVCSQPCLHICCSITYYFSNGRSDLRLSLTPPQSSNVKWTVKTCASYSQQVFQYKPQPSHAHLHINSLYRIWIDFIIFHPAELIHIVFFGWMNFLHKNPKL